MGPKREITGLDKLIYYEIKTYKPRPTLFYKKVNNKIYLILF